MSRLINYGPIGDLSRRALPIICSIPWIFGWASMTVIGPYLFMKLLCKLGLVLFNTFLNSDKQLCGKVVLITGASSGLGEALSHLLYKKGCRVILASRDIQKLERLKQTLLSSYKPPELHMPIVVKLDLEDLNSIPLIINELLSTVGHIDILINNAGVSYRGEIISTDVSVDIKVMVINYFGQVALTKAILPSMINRKQGHIIGISSIQGKLPIPFRSCYTASKHAFQGFLECLRAEVASSNINITIANPGYIATNLSQNALTQSGTKYNVTDETTATGMTPEYVAEQIVKCLLNKDAEITLCPLQHNLAIYMKILFPSIYRYLMKIRAVKQKTLLHKQLKGN